MPRSAARSAVARAGWRRCGDWRVRHRAIRAPMSFMPRHGTPCRAQASGGRGWLCPHPHTWLALSVPPRAGLRGCLCRLLSVRPPTLTAEPHQRGRHPSFPRSQDLSTTDALSDSTVSKKVQQQQPSTAAPTTTIVPEPFSTASWNSAMSAEPAQPVARAASSELPAYDVESGWRKDIAFWLGVSDEYCRRPRTKLVQIVGWYRCDDNVDSWERAYGGPCARSRVLKDTINGYCYEGPARSSR